MPSVAASERGTAQTHPAQPSLLALLDGGWTSGLEGAADPSRLRAGSSRTLLERGAAAGESPVGQAAGAGVDPDREYRPTRDIGWEAGMTTSQG
jgi:hypothetical protein